jgi:hypothetical protein
MLPPLNIFNWTLKNPTLNEKMNFQLETLKIKVNYYQIN